MTPGIGRIVWFFDVDAEPGDAPRASDVTWVGTFEGALSLRLCIKHPVLGIQWANVPLAKECTPGEATPGHWCWPPRS